uniref:Uncharacterized protein n=1 Tax=Cacopsylla melanoneura TaxID=428564 RepID=A0A8D8RXZ9_9HEMI
MANQIRKVSLMSILKAIIFILKYGCCFLKLIIGTLKDNDTNHSIRFNTVGSIPFLPRFLFFLYKVLVLFIYFYIVRIQFYYIYFLLNVKILNMHFSILKTDTIYFMQYE